MTTVSYSVFRQNLSLYLDKAEEDCEEIVVTRSKGRRAVVVPFDEYLSLKETSYLLSTAKNRKHLEKSFREIREGKTVSVDLPLV